MKRAEEGEQFYLGFLEAIKKAEAQASVERIARIREAAKGGAVINRKTITRKDGSVEVSEGYAAPQWQADAWTSGRKEPQNWGQVQRIQQEVTASPEVLALFAAWGETSRRLQEAKVIGGEYEELPDKEE